MSQDFEIQNGVQLILKGLADTAKSAGLRRKLRAGRRRFDCRYGQEFFTSPFTSIPLLRSIQPHIQ